MKKSILPLILMGIGSFMRGFFGEMKIQDRFNKEST